MKESVKKARLILILSKGECLMECLISIFVFTILLAAVTMMIIISMKITGDANRDAESMQTEINEVLSGTAASETGNAKLLIGEVIIDIPIILYVEGDFIAFSPWEEVDNE